jgi:hypothetical protein
MERKLVEVPPAEIETFDEQQQEVMTGLSASLVFNANETGYQKWANRPAQRVAVPVSHPDEVIEAPSNGRASAGQCSSASPLTGRH